MKRSIGRVSALLVLVLVASLLLTGLANAQGPERKIIVFQTGLDEADQENIVRGAGGEVLKPLPLINGMAVLLPEQAERGLRNRPGVLRIDEDTIMYVIGKPADDGAAEAETTVWGVSRIAAPNAWTGGYRGAGAKVGVIYTGISTSHPDITVWGGVNTTGRKPSNKYADDNGHGTHVAGIIAAKDNDIGVVGVAPEARLYAIKVLGASGTGWTSDIVEGIDWAVKNSMHVINMSLGGGGDNQSLHDAIIEAKKAGIVVVISAGNSGPNDNTVTYPAKYAEAIAVSASTQSNGIASFSSRGPEVDLIAPGAGIYSTYKGSGYATLSGTSMAAPHVVGVVALRIGKNLALGRTETADQIRQTLTSTADSLGLTAHEQGSGLVNAQDVVAAP